MRKFTLGLFIAAGTMMADVPYPPTTGGSTYITDSLAVGIQMLKTAWQWWMS